MSKKWRIAGINFDHFHMGDLLRTAFEHPNAEIVGISDEQPERMVEAQRNFSLSDQQVFTDYRQCLEKTKPDIVILCPASAKHGEWTEKVAPFGVHILMEKPFAASLKEADAMIAAQKKSGKSLFINWPLAWYPPHLTSRRLIDEGLVGEVQEVHYYGGNRGPLWHGADKIEMTEEQVQRGKPNSWFYKKAQGGGSLQDYMGYGTTLGTWFQNNRKPIEVTCVVDEPAGLEVDEHSITVARYAHGMSKFETRWGTFTDPWVHQPTPRGGYLLKCTDGTIASYDYEKSVRVQTRQRPEGFDVPNDEVPAALKNPIVHFIHCLETGSPLHGPVTAETSRIGQQIIDSAVLSAQLKRTVRLVE